MSTCTDDDVLQFLQGAQLRLTGASLAGIKSVLFDVLKEFFDNSSAWTEAIDIAIAPATVAYDVVPNGGQLVRLVGVVDAQNFPQPAIMPDIGVIRFAHPYNTAATFTATLVKTVAKPTKKDGLPVVPDWTFSLWGGGILDGVLGNMMNQPAKSYSDKKQAVYHLQRFRDAITRARVAALRRNTFGTQAWIYPQSYSTRTQRGGISVGNDNRFQ